MYFIISLNSLQSQQYCYVPLIYQFSIFFLLIERESGTPKVTINDKDTKKILDFVILSVATIESTVFLSIVNSDGFVKSRKTPFFVVPAEAGIQSFQMVTDGLDSGFHRSDDFLRSRQLCTFLFFFYKRS